MRQYELMFIVRPGLDEESQKAVLDKVIALATDAGGQVKELNVWGKRKMAYEIKGYSEGVYAVADLELPDKGLVEMRRVLDLNEDIIRHMILRK